ncbi:hypothetical protein AB0H71_12935 [Nocardia sp. NPDC050697]|uniref:hypothetical protein n=1 Tax=Nocardia sp. NPDC050697 TaxID=3155158 RepID=UPI0033EF8294
MTEENLRRIRDDFTENFDDLHDMPAKLNEGFDRVRTVSLASYFALTGLRDEIQEKLKEALAKLQEAAEGMFAPWLFVDYASKWQLVGATVGTAYGVQNKEDYNLEGNWDGSAYKSYKESKGYQSAAMETIRELCENVHEQLLIIAEEGRILFKALIDKMGTIISEIGVFALESAETAGAAVVWTINDLNAAIVAAGEAIVEFITNFLEVQIKVQIASNELENMIRAPKGLPPAADGTTQWPAPNTKEYDNRDDDWHLDGDDE